ncbi:MAG TPA: hypothetical protein VFO05_08065 [Candidatus Limnocylindrales bacterium]|nr:hypothetical protein [Candidatus Limnocylindrales bacterium]
MSGPVGRAVLAIAWLAIVAVLSLGAAGIVATMAHQPGTDARPELTYAGDTAAEPELGAAERELSELSSEVADLSDLGRLAIGQLTAGNSDALDATVASGEGLASTITSHTESIRAQLDGVPGLGRDAELHLSPGLRRRHELAMSALAATDGLEAQWSRLAVSSAAASRITTLLTSHDQTTADAAAAGRAERYEEAIGLLDESDALMAQSRAFRDTLSRTVDVSTLTQWLDVNAAYDAALRQLYQALIDSGGRVNDEVRAAFAAEAAAASRLPPDSRALVVILSEIGRGGLNQAVITIEQARGELDSAISLIGATADASELPLDDEPVVPPSP